MEDEDGLKHTAIIFHEEWREHPAITDALEVIEGFLESPMVTGLVEIVDRDPVSALFLYPTGRVWSIGEVVRMLSDRGERGGIRAGLELMYTAGQILVEGAEAGQSQGVYSHGGLTPRRIMIKADGQVMVIGYGLPQVEILQFHATPTRIPREDSFRYCPPERMEARPEDLSSDLFGLVLIAFELMTGKPVYDGLVNDIRQQAARSEGSRRLFRFREVLPESVRNVLAKVLRPDPEARYVLGEDFLDDVHTLLSDRAVPGPSLMDLMSELQSEHRRVGESMQMGSTQMVDGAELRNQLNEGALGRSSHNVWQAKPNRKPVRSQDEDLAPPPDVTPPVAPADVDVGSAFDAPQDDEGVQPGARWSKVKRKIKRSASREPVEGLEEPVSATVEAEPPLVVEQVSEELAPEPPRVPPPSGRRLARRTVTSQEITDSVTAPPIVPSGVSSPPTADDLLLQIRGGRGLDDSSSLSGQHTSVLERTGQLEVTIGEEDDDCATVMMTPEQLRSKLAQEVKESPPASKPALSKTTSTRGGDDLSVELVGLDGQRWSVSISPQRSVGEVIARMVGVELMLPIDQAGEIQAWYRLERDGKRIDPLAPASVLSHSAASVVRIPADTRLVEVSVVSSGQGVRFSNPMNTAVPVQSLVEHLRQWLALPEGRWHLSYNDQVLAGHQILADIAGEGVLALQFSQGSA